jgi:hypothetical protein
VISVAHYLLVHGSPRVEESHLIPVLLFDSLKPPLSHLFLPFLTFLLLFFEVEHLLFLQIQY